MVEAHLPRPAPPPQVFSLYRGMSPQLVGGALETGVNYAVYQAALAAMQGPSLALPPAAAVPLSAAAAGAVLSLVLSPAELVKVRAGCQLAAGQVGGVNRQTCGSCRQRRYRPMNGWR